MPGGGPIRQTDDSYAGLGESSGADTNTDSPAEAEWSLRVRTVMSSSCPNCRAA